MERDYGDDDDDNEAEMVSRVRRADPSQCKK